MLLVNHWTTEPTCKWLLLNNNFIHGLMILLFIPAGGKSTEGSQ